MTKTHIFAAGLIALSGCLLFAGNGLTKGDYDPDEYGPEEAIEWIEPVNATFEHKIHTMDAGLSCDSCHDELFEMEAGAANADAFTMKAMADGKFCGGCHDGDTAFATDTNCGSCHATADEPIVWNEPTKAAFSHNAHVEEFSLECASCHNKVFTMKKGAVGKDDFTMASFKEGKYCGYCHNGDDAFVASSQCGSCHIPPTDKIVFTQPVKAVAFEHDIHVKKAKLSCESCHKDVFVMKKGDVEHQEQIKSEDPAEKRVYLEKLHSKYCGKCHDSSQAFGYLTRCTVCHIGVKGLDAMNGGSDKGEGGHGKSNH